jgi:hypothetical protein
MNIVASIQSAITGWFDIFAGRAAWYERFLFNVAGLAQAIVIFGFVALACIFAHAAGMGAAIPSPSVLIVQLIGLAMPLLALVLTVYISRAILRFDTPPLELIVPGIYLLAVYLIVGTLLDFGGPIFAVLVYLLVAYALFQQAKVCAKLSVANSIAYAFLALVLLVALPSSLYMLAGAGRAPI